MTTSDENSGNSETTGLVPLEHGLGKAIGLLAGGIGSARQRKTEHGLPVVAPVATAQAVATDEREIDRPDGWPTPLRSCIVGVRWDDHVSTKHGWDGFPRGYDVSPVVPVETVEMARTYWAAYRDICAPLDEASLARALLGLRDMTIRKAEEGADWQVTLDNWLEQQPPDVAGSAATPSERLMALYASLRETPWLKKLFAARRNTDLMPLAQTLIGLGDDLILKDRGGNSGTEFRGCNAYLVDGSDATGIDNSGGSSILYKAVGNIGVETTEAAEFSATDKLFARISSGGGPAEEADFSNAAQALCAAASAIAQVDLLFGVGSNIASASTTDLSTATEAAVTVTGTTTITSFGTVTRGIRFVRFAASLTLTYHATALILPGAANIQTEAGDTAFMYSLGSGNWVCMAYVRGAGSLATQRSNAVDITGGTIAGITDLAVSDGGTGSSTSRGALDNLFVQGADVASATTTNLASVTGQFVNITGTTTITGFGTTTAGRFRWLRFAAALTLTHNGTSLILPGAANITTAAGDTCLAMSLGSGNWMVPSYQRADGTAVVVTPVSRGGTGAATKALARVALGGGAAALSDGATIATDCSANDTFAVTLGGNRTLGNPTNVVADTWYTWVLKQDGTGSRTLALDTNFVQADGDSFAMKTAANSTTMLVAYAETTSRLLVSAKKYA